MSYPGNASLAQDIQVRILETFEQTLTLVESESLKEAKLGCDFILRLDPMFEPARWLQDRLDNAGGEIVLDDLKEAVAAIDVAPPAAEEVESEEVAEVAPEAPAEPEAESEPVNNTGGERAATQAATFGDAEIPEPATDEEVMDAPVAALDTESEQRIQDLLSEGQAAFERAEYQTAIDAWSRIFLIDIDHPEANERIELARKLKAEAERTIEEAYHEALRLLEGGDVEGGRAGLQKVVEMQPDHLLAREQLDKLEDVASAPAPAPSEPGAAEPSEFEGIGAELGDELEALEDSTLSDPALSDSAPSEGALSDPLLDEAPAGDLLDDPEDRYTSTPGAIPIPKQKLKPKPASGDTDKKKLLLYVGAAVLLVVVVGGWLLISNWSSIFPNSSETAVADATDRPDPVERATELHESGKTSTAVAQLRRLPPSHDLYSEAQALIVQWEAELSAGTEEVGPSEAELEKFSELVTQAERAQGRKEYLRVDELLTAAALIQPLDETAMNLKMVADAELEPLRTLVAIFRQGEWELVLRDLWRLREQMPNSPDVNRLMVDSYYNLGVRALQRGDSVSAADYFAEGLELSPKDQAIERVTKFAETYRNRPEDLLYRIYVKYLPFR